MSSRPFCNKCDKYATLGGCNCDDPDFGAPIKSSVVSSKDVVTDEVPYSWNDVKDATNNLYKAFFNPEVNDYVNDIAMNALPHCLTQILAYCAVYPPTEDSLVDDYHLLCRAYIQLEEEGKIGNGK
jgi:mannitol-1-phosphate/altronate dehydrogenase